MIEIKRNAQKPTQTAQKSPQQPAAAPGGAEAINNPSEAQKAQKLPLKEWDKNYLAIYRAVFDFHKAHNPVTLNDPDYWTRTSQDAVSVAAQFDNDDFACAMVRAVFEELEKDYNNIKSRAI